MFHIFLAFRECTSKRVGLSDLLRNRKFKHLNRSKAGFLTAVATKGFSECVKDEFLTYFAPYTENELKINFQKMNIDKSYETMIKFLMYEDSAVGPLLSAEYFEICSKYIQKCNDCGLLDIEN